MPDRPPPAVPQPSDPPKMLPPVGPLPMTESYQGGQSSQGAPQAAHVVLPDGWNEYQRLVLSTLDRHNDMIEAMQASQTTLTRDLSGLAVEMRLLTRALTEQSETNREVAHEIRAEVQAIRAKVGDHDVALARLEGANTTLERVDQERIQNTSRWSGWILPFITIIVSAVLSLVVTILSRK